MASLYQNIFSYVSSSGTPVSGSFVINNAQWNLATTLSLHDSPFLTFGSGSGGLQITGSTDVNFSSYYPALGPGSIIFIVFSGSTWSYDVDSITDSVGFATFNVTNLTGPSITPSPGISTVGFAITAAGAGAQIANDVNNRVLTATGTQGSINAEANLTFDGSNLNITGTLNADTKNFDIPHPSKPGWRLRYSSLEGPEKGIYIRGKVKGDGLITLPDYWNDLIVENSISVQLTPIGKACGHYVVITSPTEITVACECGDVDAYYAIFAERKSKDPLIVEYNPTTK